MEYSLIFNYLYIYTGGICQLQFLILLHCFAFFCVWNNSANASERQMQKNNVYVMVHVSGGGGGGGCMGLEVEFRALTVWGKSC